MTTWIQELETPHPPATLSPQKAIVARCRQHVVSALGSLRVAAPLITVVLAAGYIVSARTPIDRAASEFGGPMAAEVLPLLALAGIAIAMWRHRPDLERDPVRPVAGNVALASGAVSLGLVGMQLLRPEMSNQLLGPTISVALTGSYVASWGLRAPALMRTVALLSLLTWNSIATRVDEIVSNTLARPSDMVYRRLAQVPALEIGDEPWRLYTATMYHGSLIVVAIVVLVVAITRQRFTPRLIVDVVVTAGVTLVAHHAFVLASPVDEYDPGGVASVSAHPLFELAIAVVGVLGLLAVTRRRSERRSPASSTAEGRDPYIFGLEHTDPSTGVVALLYSGTGALAMLLVHLAV